MNANALLRFYVLHCVVLPLAAILFIAVHFWRFAKTAASMCNRQPKPPVKEASPVAEEHEVLR